MSAETLTRAEVDRFVLERVADALTIDAGELDVDEDGLGSSLETIMAVHDIQNELKIEWATIADIKRDLGFPSIAQEGQIDNVETSRPMTIRRLQEATWKKYELAQRQIEGVRKSA